MIRKKPRVGVDVDGVLADILEPCFKVASEMMGSEITMDHMVAWDLDHLLPPDRIEEFWLRIGEPGLCRGLKPYPGAVEGLAALREVADVYIVTAYLHDAVQWVHERDKWIQEHFGIPSKKMVHTKAKYTFSGKALIDDKPQNIQEWGDEHGTGIPILWSMPYNEKAQFTASLDYKVVRTNSWENIVRVIESLV